MYQLGEQFEFDNEKSKTNEENIIKGDKYRISILTPNLIRLEYNNNGIFEDRPTELVWHRNFKKSSFSVKEDQNYLEVTTNFFQLVYQKEKTFVGPKINPTANLKINILNQEKFWYVNHPEIRNYKSFGYSFDNSKESFYKGLFSQDGFVSIDDSKSYVFKENGQVEERGYATVDMYVFIYNNDFNTCLKDYFQLTGQPPLIPRYALGNWWSRNEVYDDVSLKNLMDEFDKEEIPLSVLLLDRQWFINKLDGKEYTSGFSWNSDLFRSPINMVEYMHSKGIRVGLNINPTEGILPYEENFEKMSQYLIKDSNGNIPFDILNPTFIDAYFKILIHPQDSIGIDFFWIDYNNPKNLKPQWLLNHYHFYDMMRNYKRRPMVLTRNPDVASHRYPVLYAGKNIVSWTGLKDMVWQNILAAQKGISYVAHNISGYYKGIEDNDLYTRFVQLGTFSPILKFGVDKGKFYKREPWRWSVKTYEIVKNYLQLRHRLIPYLYTESYKYHNDGITLVNPIYYKFPEMYDDDNYKYEYYFGSQLLIAPIIRKKDYVMNRVIHKFFMPSGIWYDFTTGKKFPGDKSYVSFYKDQDYPVFAKAGSIIPLGSNDILNDTTPPKDMEFQIFPGVSNKYELYEDDGLSDIHKKGYYIKTLIEYNYLPNNYTVIMRAIEGKSKIIPDKRNYKFTFRNTRKANDVIAYFNNEIVQSNSYIKGADFIVEIKDVPTIGQLTLNCKGKDIEIDAVRLVNEDIFSIISDLQIETEMKERLDKVIFSELPIKKKRIEVRKLKRKGLEAKFIKLFLKLLEYVEQV